ncbi:MAG: hypothetical protein OEQ47_19290 [Acidimicrobiia bacterium]|nr:hypothetical protein [Acidimicrobiia bacterium]
MGMTVPIWVAALDDDLVVVRVARLARRRVFFERQARWILELPKEVEPPVPGMRLAHLGFDDAGNPLPVRDTDRQSG